MSRSSIAYRGVPYQCLISSTRAADCLEILLGMTRLLLNGYSVTVSLCLTFKKTSDQSNLTKAAPNDPTHMARGVHCIRCHRFQQRDRQTDRPRCQQWHRLCLSRPGVGKLRPAGRLRPARVYYAAHRHVHVRSLNAVMRITTSKLVPQFKNIMQNCEQLHSSHWF